MSRAEKIPVVRAVDPGSAPAPKESRTEETASVARASEEVKVARRRRFSAEFKRQVLREADACREAGEIGALLRRHGLYSSHLTVWRRQRDEGLVPKKRGRKPSFKNPLAEENAKLQRELAKATARAERAERLLELQKKVAELLGEPFPPPPELMPVELEAAEAPKSRPKRRRRR